MSAHNPPAAEGPEPRLIADTVVVRRDALEMILARYLSGNPNRDVRSDNAADLLLRALGRQLGRERIVFDNSAWGRLNDGGDDGKR